MGRVQIPNKEKFQELSDSQANKPIPIKLMIDGRRT